MIREAIVKLVNGESLTRDEAAAAMDMIMTGEATPAQVGSFLTALRLKVETVDELAGLAEVMQEKAIHVHIPHLDRPVLDIVGTGGDGQNTFNISTTSAFVVAGAGAVVAKHGNRAASSKCGSADVLEALGVNINLKAEQVSTCLEKAGVGFMFAALFHPSMKYAGPVRREIGIRTVFNILGPLTNPARVKRMLIGAPSPDVAAKMAEALQKMDCEYALVVHSADGLDEISIAASTYVFEVRKGSDVRKRVLHPEDFGVRRYDKEVMKGGNAEDNREITLKILDGELCPQRDVVLINAAAALVVAGLAEDFRQGAEQASLSIDSGEAKKRMHELVQLSQSFAG